MNPVIASAFVFIGCCSNMIFLEYLITAIPTCGNLITFSQFLFISCEGLITTSKFFTVTPKIPIRNYLVMVAYFFLVQVANNASYMFKVSIPLQMIFRAGSMIPSLVLGVLILKKNYSKAKYLSVILVTIGIATCTIASAKQEVKSVHENKELSKDPETEAQNVFQDLMLWTLGLVMLTVALFLTAGMGIIQEKTYKQFGKHPKESLFYNHFLPLPGFVFLASDISHHISLFNQTTPVHLGLGFSLPQMWLFLIGNILTQYICIRSVFILTTECSALSVTLVVTLRKFVSLILSIFYFHNPFTYLHWIGTVCTFIGVILFTEMVHIPGLMAPKKTAKAD
uniref:UDP-xylose and UDP-N-acetylglucosamine transporter-like n=1 Tax=Crassostrea virginica TaxID=6565 RepID=A0A8B8BG13_CRAVI|nr:UDP-xylose and UDP-N-acetylglucosamine transporter-like [Crassostrea virginica]XP_022301739.1 UDP-xylose and UDP-N-acetylglucosamine transporter-like [Crassostrea virginica]